MKSETRKPHITVMLEPIGAIIYGVSILAGCSKPVPDQAYI